MVARVKPKLTMTQVKAQARQRRRRALYLWQVAGRTYREIGQQLGITKQRVYQMVGEALKRKEKPERPE
jgi:DNA-directed RNA polymerase specialized sigma subunit